MRTVYISGPITGIPDYRERFAEKAEDLRRLGWTVVNPAELPQGVFTHETYMKIDLLMLDECDAAFFFGDVASSEGASMEYARALETNKPIMMQQTYTPDVLEELLEFESGLRMEGR